MGRKNEIRKKRSSFLRVEKRNRMFFVPGAISVSPLCVASDECVKKGGFFLSLDVTKFENISTSKITAFTDSATKRRPAKNPPSIE